MKQIYLTPWKDCLYAEIREKASPSLNNFIRITPWVKWQQLRDINGKGRMQWYIVVDTTADTEKRLSVFADYVCRMEGYEAVCKICPHDLNYEYMKYFPGYDNIHVVY